MRWKDTLVAFALVTSLAVRASAGDPPIARSDDAATEKQRGDLAMDALRFDEALEAYSHAYELGHDPAVLYNRGRLYQARGDWPKALDDLETFDRDASPPLRAKVPKLAELLAEMRAHVSTLSIKCNVAGARVTVRGTEVGSTPLENLRVSSGPARIEVTAPDYAPNASDATLRGGGATVLEIVLVSRTAVAVTPKEPHPDEPPKKGVTGQWWFWAGAGAIVVGAVVTIIVVSQTEKSPANGDGFSPSRVSSGLFVW